MADSHWLDRFAAELRRQRLPAGYRVRLLDELADHLSELEQETTSMEAQVLLEERIGRPEVIAAEARSEYTRRTFAGRHPVLTFGVAPLFAVLGILLTTLFVTYLVLMLASLTTPQLREQSIPPTTLQWCVAYSAVWFVRLAPFGVAAWLFARAGRRAQRPKWGLVACTIVAALAFVFWMGIREETTEHPGLVFFGLAIQQVPHPEQYVQAALPLAIGLWSTWSLLRAARDTEALPSAA
jgi:hypothetical protein